MKIFMCAVMLVSSLAQASENPSSTASCLDFYKVATGRADKSVADRVATVEIVTAATAILALFRPRASNGELWSYPKTFATDGIATGFWIFVPYQIYQGIVDSQKRDSYNRAIQMIDEAYSMAPAKNGQLEKMYNKVILQSNDPSLINKMSIDDFASTIQKMNENHSLCPSGIKMMGEVSKLLIKELRNQ